MDVKDKCNHCNGLYVKFRGNQKYCSVYCRDGEREKVNEGMSIVKNKERDEAVEEFGDMCYDMHIQNTNGRESNEEMFKLGIQSVLEEKEILVKICIDHPIYRVPKGSEDKIKKPHYF